MGFDLLGHLLRHTLALAIMLGCGNSIIHFMFQLVLLFLESALDLCELIDLVRHLILGILALLAEGGDGSFVLELVLFEVTAKFQKLLLTFLVEFNLSSSGTASFIKTFAEVIKFTGQFSTLFLNLRSGLAFSFKFLFKFFNVGVSFLELLLGLTNQVG